MSDYIRVWIDAKPINLYIPFLIKPNLKGNNIG